MSDSATDLNRMLAALTGRSPFTVTWMISRRFACVGCRQRIRYHSRNLTQAYLDHVRKCRLHPLHDLLRTGGAQ